MCQHHVAQLSHQKVKISMHLISMLAKFPQYPRASHDQPKMTYLSPFSSPRHWTPKFL